MKRIKNITFIFLLIYFIFPVLVNASTSLDTENQRPVVGTSIEIAVDIDYGKTVYISEAHYYVNYDSSYLQLEEVIWTQTKGTHIARNGMVELDKTSSTGAWEFGMPIVLKFKTLKEGVSKLTISEKAPAKYQDGSTVSQFYSGITINAVAPSTATKIGTLKVDGFLLSPTFNANKYKYTLTVPPTTTKVNIVATKGEKNQTITGTGTRELNYGDNKVRVVVTAQNGATSTYEITIHRTDDRTEDVTLKSLSVSNTEIKYTKGKKVYEATVSKTIDSVFISAQANDARAQLMGTGTRSLNIGENTFYIYVKGADGEEETYTIKITRSDKVIEDNVESTYLKNIIVNDINIKTEENVFNYITSVDSSVDKLNFTITPKSTTAKYKINDYKLKTGLNKITITVTDGDLPPTDYTITVYKQLRITKKYATLEELTSLTEITEDVYYETTNPKTIDASILSFLLNNKKELYYSVINDNKGILYQLVIPAEYNKSFNPSLKQTAESPLTYNTELPSGISVMLYVGDLYPDGSELRIYTYDELGLYTDLTTSVKVSNGYVNFTTNGQKNYVLSYQQMNTPTTFDLTKILPMVLLGGAVLFLLVYIIKTKSKSKNNKKSNEPLY